jgi:MFS family permease
MRMAIWHAGNTVANILSGFLAAGILENMDGIAGLHAWQWFFLIEGIASIAVALMAFIILPGWPSDTNAVWPSKKGFLTEQESEMAQYRVLLSNGGRDERVGGTWDGLKEALKEPFTWMFCAMHFGLTISQSYKDFLPSVSNFHLKTQGEG